MARHCVVAKYQVVEKMVEKEKMVGKQQILEKDKEDIGIEMKDIEKNDTWEHCE